MSRFDINSMYSSGNNLKIGQTSSDLYDGGNARLDLNYKPNYNLNTTNRSSLGSGLANTVGGTKTDTGFLSGLMDGSQNSLNTIQGFSGLANLGLGLAGFLSNQKMMKKQGALMDQQIANNAKEMSRRDNAISSYEQATRDAYSKYGK